MRTDGDDEGSDETLVETGATRAEALTVGVKVDRFVILSVIGEGAIGRVYAAYDPELDRQIALKLRKGAPGPEDARVRREAQALAKITHPNVVTVYDVGEHEGQLYVAMEYVAGETLRCWAQTRPDWRAVVDAFVAAGRGLIAVHEAGLLHRDVKPDNIMRGSDGRVRVMDFGLARESVESSLPGEREPGDLRSGTTLTRTGTLAGTPAYMAPEQHLGLPLDARTDQFALCVSLWEALYGERPFAGNNLAALTYNVTSGNRRAAPSESAVPAWVRRAIERGLAVEPEQRYPDVAALLDALGQDPIAQRRRRSWLGAALVSIVASSSFAGWWWSSNARSVHAPTPPCAEVERFDAVWDPARSPAELAAAFERSGLPLARSAAEHAAQGLDAWAQQWNDSRRDACEATHVRHEQSTALMDSRIACLDRRRARVAGIIAAFMEADTDLVREAPTIVAKLAPLDECADALRLMALTPLPADARTSATITELSLRIESLGARIDTGHTDSVVVESRTLAAEADATGYAPLRFDAMMLVANAEEIESYPASLETTRAAYYLALRADLIAQAARAALDMMYLTAMIEPTSPTLTIWSEHTRVLVERAEPEGPLEARRLANLGIIAWSNADIPQAIEHTRAAIVIAERSIGPRSVTVADYHNNLGYMTLLLGDEAEARTEIELARSTWTEILGPEHPRLGVADLSLAEIAIEQDRLADARRLAERALELCEAAGETTGLNISYALNVIAEIDRREGKLAAARIGHERALALMLAELGEDHWRTAHARLGLGELALQEGDIDEALEQLTAAARVFEPLGSNKREHGRALFGLARAEAARGHLDPAREHAVHARERFVELGRRGERDRVAVDRWLRELP